MSLLKTALCAMAILVGVAVASIGAREAAGAADPSRAAGYGRCSKCNCRHFEGNSRTCANSGCGHSYYDHY